MVAGFRCDLVVSYPAIRSWYSAPCWYRRALESPRLQEWSPSRCRTYVEADRDRDQDGPRWTQGQRQRRQNWRSRCNWIVARCQGRRALAKRRWRRRPGIGTIDDVQLES